MTLNNEGWKPELELKWAILSVSIANRLKKIMYTELKWRKEMKIWSILLFSSKKLKKLIVYLSK